MNRAVALVLATTACRLGAAAPAPERLRIESTRGPAGEPALLAELRADPIRLPDDPLVPKLSALRDRALIEVVNCHSNHRASLVGDRATCVDVLWAGERVRAWINSTSLNRATVGAGTSRARTVAISYTRETDERTMLWLDADASPLAAA